MASEVAARYKALKSHWEDWAKDPETFGFWIAPPGDLPWLFEKFIPSLFNRIAALQEFQHLWERDYGEK